MNRLGALASLVGAVAALAACASSAAPREVLGDAGIAETGRASAVVLDAALLGKECVAACGGDVCASTTLEVTCPAEYCLFDRARGPSYCSAACDHAACPDGFACEEKLSVTKPVEPSSPLATKVCRRLAVACGNGRVEAGEVCDDGNARDDDACSADCKVVDPPRVELSVHFGVAILGDDAVTYPLHATIAAGAPAAGDSQGCGRVDLSRAANAILLSATVCDDATKGRLRFVARVPVAKGKVTDVASVEAYYATGAARERPLRPFVMEGLGSTASVEVERTSQGGVALHGKLAAAFEPPVGPSFPPYGIAAEFVVVPPKP